MIQKPWEELQDLHEEQVELQNITVPEGVYPLSGDGIIGKAYEELLELEPGDTS